MKMKHQMLTLKGDALAWGAGQRGEAFDGPARNERLVASVYLSNSLLYQWHP